MDHFVKMCWLLRIWNNCKDAITSIPYIYIDVVNAGYQKIAVMFKFCNATVL